MAAVALQEDDRVYADAVVEKSRRQSRRKLWTYYPDKGALSRNKYPKHLAFLAAGATHRERAFIAGNRVGKCVSGDTVIENPRGQDRKVEDIDGPHWVWSWDGEKRVPALAEKPFVKPSEMLYRVWTENGQYVDCAAEHRFLTGAGWLFLSDLFGFVPCLPESTEGTGPLGSLQDVRRCLEIGQGFLGGYRPGHRSDGGLLRYAAESARSFLPSQDGVLPYTPAWSRLGALANKGKCSLSRFFGHLSNPYVQPPILAPFAGSLEQAFCTPLGLCRDSHRAPQQQGAAASARPRSVGEGGARQSESSRAFVSPHGGSNSIICYQKIGVGAIYDFHVPGYKNYCTAGMVHHNTEGCGGYETALHLTGLYPDWWEGRRFDHPIRAWAAGDTSQTVRDIIQDKLLGPIDDFGTGLIPHDNLSRITRKAGIPDAVETIVVKHVSGGNSLLGFKSYDQGRKSFQGTAQHIIWCDEEPPEDVYVECVLRTMTVGGLVMGTFTPMEGLSSVVTSFLPGGKAPATEVDTGPKYVVMAGWDDVPHLSDEVKKSLLASIPLHQRDARSKGIPQLGSGAIYPVAETEITIEPFEIPKHYPRVWVMDVGWNRTAALWGAIDRETSTVYLYSEHYRGQAEPSVHAEAIRGRGKWIPGVIDPAARGRSQKDGESLMDQYEDLGLELTPANNAVESGIYATLERLSGGRIKVFKTLHNFLGEYRIYRRDDKGKVVKVNDHLMDCLRYLVTTGIDVAETEVSQQLVTAGRSNAGPDGWMG